jgi:hypothetical protein
MNNTKFRGLVTELQCQTYFSQLNINVSTPISENCKYDMIVDIEGQLLRIQVKSCKEEKNGINFNTRSSYMTANGSKSTYYSKKDIDYFATFYNNQCYLIPVEQCGTSEKKLSFTKDYAKRYKIGFLDDYQADLILQKIKGNEILPNSEVMVIKQYDYNDNLIAIYPNLASAAKSLGKTSSAHISDCINNKRQTAYGYKWRKEEE